MTLSRTIDTCGRLVRLRLLLPMLLGIVGAGPAAAICLPVAGTPDARIQLASTRPEAPAAGDVRLTYLGHSSFLIETPEGATAVTDYNGFHRADFAPDIVTMNNAHSTHYSNVVEPEVQHVLRGWDPEGGVAEHALDYLDLSITNIPTNVRDFGGTRYNGNSIFIFEAADLCIAHLGHLHHTLTDEDLGALGQIDVLLAPIDGAWTMSHQMLATVVMQIRPAVVIPMHAVTNYTVGRFSALLEGRYETVVSEEPSLTVSRLGMPYAKLIVLPAAG